MTFDIALYLGQNGVTLAAIYALLGFALVLVFAVTRVIFIPQGEIMTFAALSLVAIRNGQPPLLAWLLVGLGAVAFALDGITAVRAGQAHRLVRVAAVNLLPAGLVLVGVYTLPLATLSYPVQIVLTLLMSAAFGPLLYRVVYAPAAHASVLTLLLLSVALHMALSGLGLLLFGPEGSQLPAFTDGSFQLGGMPVGLQSLWIVGTSLVLLLALFLFFRYTLYGKALRATAVSRTGAQLMGISPAFAGRAAFLLAATIGAWSGILVATTTVIDYDAGFVIGLKGFVAAIIGGLSSYPLAAIGALTVGLTESFASFWASPYKDVIVFLLIIPVLLWRSLASAHHEEDEL
ncbi:MAG: branched-chain amino acid ABC transporter permease [Betaproteobacteria bacterium]|nr:branched-chain amino acid ABC transporter permease [Betaproteobacteria bacterium]